MCKTLLRFFAFSLLLFTMTIAVAQESYYASIDSVKGGAPLKEALHNLLKKHKVIPYGPGVSSTWGAFYEIDVVIGTENRVADMYSPTVRYFGKKGDAVAGMNIEHSVAKSWWGSSKNVNAYYDLHHLNPSDAEANSNKSNHPLANLEKITWDNGVAFVGEATIEGSKTKAYEPCDEYKGDFARTYMYMFTCYQDLTFKYTWMNYENSAYPTLKPWAVELLLQWHELDPVSEKELQRNNAVFNIQGNRNPYIDFPQLAHYVWGDSADYTFFVGDSYFEVPSDSLPFGTYLAENFSSDLGEFASVEVVGNYPWSNKYGCAYVSAYDSEQKINNAAESWLVSPTLNLSKAGKVKIAFDYLSKYNEAGTAAERNCLMVSTDYTGDVAAATWRAIDFSIEENVVDYIFTRTGDILLPAEYSGCANVTIAFKYVATAAKAGTFEVKNLVVAEYEDSDEDDETGDDTDDTPADEGTGAEYSFYDEFCLLTDLSQLACGDSVIIAYNTIVLAKQASNYREALDGAVKDGNALLSYPADAQKLIVEAGATDGSFAFNADGKYLAAASSSKNYLRSVDVINNNSSWVIEIDTKGNAKIVSQGSYTSNVLQYNTGAPRFSCYKGTQESVNIYVKKPSGNSNTGINFATTEMLVDVYTLYGVCVKRKVQPSQSLEGLPAGVYIVEGKKFNVNK